MPLIGGFSAKRGSKPNRLVMVLLLLAWFSAVAGLWVFWWDLATGWRIFSSLLVALTTPSFDDIRFGLRGR